MVAYRERNATDGCDRVSSRAPWCPDSIAREIVIDAPPERVWAIVTEAQHLAGWFSDEAEIDLRPGGAMLLTWHGHGTYRARVETVEAPHTFAFRWLRREDAGEGSTLVVMTLTPEGASTRLRVVESGFADLAWPRTTSAPLRRREPRGLGRRARRAPRLRRPRDDAREDADRLWAALGDPMRLRLLDLLLERGDTTASALATALPITRQGVAKHLAVLERAELVVARRAGREVRFAVRERAPGSGPAPDGAGRRPVGRAPGRDQADRRGRLALQHRAVVDDELLVAVVADRRLAAHDDVAAELHVALDRQPPGAHQRRRAGREARVEVAQELEVVGVELDQRQAVGQLG